MDGPCSIRRHQERFWTRVPIEKGEAKKVTRLYPECCCNRVKKRKQEIERNTKIKKRQGEKWHAHSSSSTIWTWLWPIQQQLDTPGPRKPFPFVGNKSRVSYRARVLYINIHRSQQSQEHQRRRRIVITSLAPCVLLLCYFIFIFLVCIHRWKEKEGLERERRTIRGLYIGGCLAGELNNNKNTRFIIQHLPRRAQKTRKRDRREMVMFSRYPSSATESEKKL